MRENIPADRKSFRCTLTAASVVALLSSVAICNANGADSATDAIPTATPIKHVIVLIGENWSLDSLFATYTPVAGQTIKNLLSEGVINEDGSPGLKFSETQQFQVNPPFSTYFISSTNKAAFAPFLPPPHLNGAPNAPTTLAELNANPTGVHPPFDHSVPQSDLEANEPSLDADDLDLLRSGATGAAGTTGLDTRVASATSLPNGVFQITGSNLPYDSYTGDTVHRLFHMWQQADCNIANATEENPSGCLGDLYPFVGLARDDSSGNSMGFFNMAEGDVPLLKQIADQYTLADNMHQSIMGGTAANHMALGTGDAISWTSFQGQDAPNANIADPTPQSSTSVKFKVDGTWTNCSDKTQPGIKPITDYLASLPYKPLPNCADKQFYMINNVSPGFLPNGTIDAANILKSAKVPPSNLRTIGDALNEKNIPWTYYGGGYDAAVRVANGLPRDNFDRLVAVNYCDICNFESYAASIMGDAAQRQAHIKDAIDFFQAVGDDTLPAVSFLKPDSFLDGHPASSKMNLFEAMLEKVLTALQANAELFQETALIITFDESGGFHDTGYIQPLDFFGDGPRIPLLVVSPFSRGGKVVHTYYDHVSILKFIERNWGLKPLTGRSRDNLPNPTVDMDNPYVPTNNPAIGDLFDLFDFGKG